MSEKLVFCSQCKWMRRGEHDIVCQPKGPAPYSTWLGILGRTFACDRQNQDNDCQWYAPNRRTRLRALAGKWRKQ